MAEKYQKSTNETTVKRPRGRPRKVQDPQILPPKEDVSSILNEIGSRANLKTVLSALLMSSSLNQRKDAMSTVAESIVGSFDKYHKTVSNHIAMKDVEFEIKFDQKKSVQSVLFSETMTSVPGQPAGQALNVNIDYFKDLYEQKRDPEPPKKYSRHEYVEYKYNVSSIIDYYTKRFPDIIDLFDTFADICINKSDIGVFVTFTDEFIKKFFVDEYEKQYQRKKEMQDMLARQTMGLGDLNQNTEEYTDFEDTTSEEDIFSSEPQNSGPIYTHYNDITSQGAKTIGNLFDAQGRRVDIRTLRKALGGSTLQQDDTEVDKYIDQYTSVAKNDDVTVYDEIYDGITYQYHLLLGKVEGKIRKVLDNRLIKKVKYATKLADIWGYSIITINKTDPNDIIIYNPSELRIYKKKKSGLDLDNLIFGKVENVDGTNQKIKILNYAYNCYVLSLDPMVMMPIPNIVRISWYLYLMDLVEILMVYNDLIKSKSVHLLEIPVFEDSGSDPNGDGVTANNMMDSISVMNMIINNIESKLVMDTELIQGSESSEDVAMKMLKNVGLSVAYVPKLSPQSEMRDIKLDTDDQQYNKLYTMLTEKIFSVLKFPMWFRTSTQVMETFKAIPREVVQFAHLVFMSRVNSALSELEAFLEFMILLHVEEYKVSYFGSEEIPVELENIKVKIRSVLGEYLFDTAKSEQTRSTKVQSFLTISSAGWTLNPHFACEWIFPEWTIDEILLDVGQSLANKRQQIENALNTNTGMPTMEEEELSESDLAGAGSSEEAGTDGEQTATTESNKINIDWKQVRASFASAILARDKVTNDTDSQSLKNIKRRVDELLRKKYFHFNIKRV